MKDRIRALRKSLGLNQAEFGERVGVKGNTIGNYETDLRNPSEAVLISICREFNVNENWLRTGEGEMFLLLDREDELAQWAGTLLRPDMEGSFQQNFVHMLSKLNVDDWKALEKMALIMKEENEKS